MAEPQLETVVRHLRKFAAAEGHSDQHLLDCFLTRRDENAFAALVERHGQLVLSVCRLVLRHEQDAEDAFQATFLVLARKGASIRKGDSLACWLHGVARRTALKALSARTRRQREHPPDLRTPEPVSEAALREVQAILHEEIHRLPEKFQAPFVLCCLEGKSRAEAAAELDWKEGTVSGRLAEARERLRQRLARRGVSSTAALAAAALSCSAAEASLPATLVTATGKAAAAFAAGQPVSPPVLILTEGMLRAMSTTRVRIAILLCVALVLTATGGVLALTAEPAQRIVEERLAGPQQAETDKVARVAIPAAEKVADVAPPVGAWRRRFAVTWPDQQAYHAAFSPDGKLLAVAVTSTKAPPPTIKAAIRLCDPRTGAISRTLDLPEGAGVRDLAFSPDGKTLAACGSDQVFGSGAVVVWDVGTWTPRLLLTKAAQKEPTCLTFTADSKTLVVGVQANQVGRNLHLFDVASGELRVAFGEVPGVQRVALSPDGSTLASGGLYGVQLWDLATHKERPEFARDVTRPAPSGLAFSPDGKTLAVASREKDKLGHTFVVRLLDAVTGKARATLTKKVPLATDSANGQIAFAPGGILAATRTETVGQQVGLTTLWDTNTGKELTTLRHGSGGYAVAFAPGGAALATVGGSVQLWQRDHSRNWERLELYQGSMVQSLAFAPDGETLASGDWRGHVALWNPRTGALRQELTGQWIQYAVAFTPDGKAVAAVGGTYGHGAAHVWDAQTGKLRWSYNNIRESLSSIGIMPDGKTVIGGGYSGLYAWDVQTGAARQKFPKHTGGIGAMAFAPDVKTLAVAGMGEGVHVSLWEVVGEAERAKLPKHPGGVRALAFTPDGRMLVTASQRTDKRGEKIRGEVQIWDLQTEKSLRTLEVPGGAWSVAVSPDGQLLAVGSGGLEEKSLTNAGHIHLWDLSSGKLLRTAEAAEGAIAAVAFAPDGRTLALASWDGTVRLWDVGSWLAAKVEP